MKRREFFRTEFGVLICLALALPAASNHACAQPPGVDPLHDKIKKMERDIREWQTKGRDLTEIGKLIQKIGPLIQSGQRAQAEALVDRATTILASPPQPLEVDWESLERYRRKTDETQYLVFPIREVGYLSGGKPDRFLQALEEMKQRMGTVENPRRRNWGTPEQMPPVICYNSPTVLREIARLIVFGIWFHHPSGHFFSPSVQHRPKLGDFVRFGPR